MSPSSIGRRALLLLVLLALVSAACGDSDDATSQTTAAPTTAAETTVPEPADDTTATTAAETTDEGFPVTIDLATGGVTVEQRPERVVSISPTATEMLFALGAGDQIVAVDTLSDYPPEAPVTDLVAFEPNVEAILGFEPDLVVLSFDPGDVVSGLDAAGVPAIVQSAAISIADSYTQIEQLGAATGNSGGAAELVAQMQADIDALATDAPALDPPLSYYHELDDTLFSVTSSTFIGEIYALAGLENVADPADEDGSSFGFPQLSAEFLVSADPDLIFLADTKCCGQSVETVAERPGWQELTAVSTGQIVELDDDVASRWGPRIVVFLEEIVGATKLVGASSG